MKKLNALVMLVLLSLSMLAIQVYAVETDGCGTPDSCECITQGVPAAPPAATPVPAPGAPAVVPH